MGTVQKLGEHSFKVVCDCESKHVVVPDTTAPGGYSVESVRSEKLVAMLKRESDDAALKDREAQDRAEAERKAKEAKGGDKPRRRLFGRI